MKRRLFGLLGLALLGGAVFFAARGRAERGAPLLLYGNVDIREVNLAFRVGGRISEILRDEGDLVKGGDAVAKLDDEPNRREVEEARARAQQDRAHLDLLVKGYRAEEIAEARASVREREATLANARRFLRRQQDLLASRTVSPQEADDAEQREKEAAARLKSAQEQLAWMEAGYRPEEISQARAALATSEAALASAELRLADTILKAPSDGVIMTRAREPGAMVQPGATLLTLSLQRPVWVRAYVPESDLGRVRPGLMVELTTDSRPGKPYHGQVGFISPEAEFTPKSVETPDLRTSLMYRIRVVVSDPDDGLRQGMPVTIRTLAALDRPGR